MKLIRQAPRLAPCCLAALLSGAALAAAAQPASKPKTAFAPPPSAVLDYAIRARQSGLQLEGDAVVRWQASPAGYSVETETRTPLFGRILETKSEGRIDVHGLAPGSFSEKKLRKKADTVSFDRAAGTILFAGNRPSQPMPPGTQDRNSAVWQLASLARAMPSQVKTGSEWTFVVAGPRDADSWTFRVKARETVRTPAGSFPAFHIERTPPDDRGQQLAVWLSPSLDWYPVRIRFTESDGDTIEQSLAKVTRTGG